MLEERRRARPGEVALVGEHETPVGEVAEGGQAVERQWPAPVGPGQGGVDRHRGEQHQQGGEETAHPAGPERPQRDAPRALELAQQQRRDQEAAEDEEDVDAEEAAVHPADVAVVEEDRDHGHGAEAVERRDVAQARRMRRRGAVRPHPSAGHHTMLARPTRQVATMIHSEGRTGEVRRRSAAEAVLRQRTSHDDREAPRTLGPAVGPRGDRVGRGRCPGC